MAMKGSPNSLAHPPSGARSKLSGSGARWPTRDESYVVVISLEVGE
jgi:hypothetical protein